MPLHTLGDDKPPQAHKGTDRRVHREEVAVEHACDLAADVNLGAAPIVGAHDDAQQLGREVRLKLPPGSYSYLSQVRLTEAGLAVDLADIRLRKPVALILVLQPLEALPGNLHVLHCVP